MSGRDTSGRAVRAHDAARHFFRQSAVWIGIGVAWAGCCGISSNDSSSGCGPATPQCYTDTVCAVNQVCEDGRCIAAKLCTSDRDCPDGEVCFPAGDGHKAACRPPNDAGRPCLTDNDCPQGAYCILPAGCNPGYGVSGYGICDTTEPAEAAEPSLGCSPTEPCPAGMTCEYGQGCSYSGTCVAADAESDAADGAVDASADADGGEAQDDEGQDVSAEDTASDAVEEE